MDDKLKRLLDAVDELDRASLAVPNAAKEDRLKFAWGNVAKARAAFEPEDWEYGLPAYADRNAALRAYCKYFNLTPEYYEKTPRTHQAPQAKGWQGRVCGGARYLQHA